MSSSPLLACVFGNPIAQSKSPIIHHMFAQQFGIDLTYTKRFADKDAFNASANEFFGQANVVGANVTMPFKHDALRWVDKLSSQAHRAGAVNTIIAKNGHYEGGNTDGLGLLQDLKNHGVDIKGARVLMIGAGGASQGALPALIDEGLDNVTIYNRTLDKAHQLVELTNSYTQGVAEVYSVLDNNFDLVINATSLSLHGEVPEISDAVLAHRPIVYDMVYQAKPTVFLQNAAAMSCAKCIDGLGMLVNQAAHSFQMWFNEFPDTDLVYKHLKALTIQE